MQTETAAAAIQVGMEGARGMQNLTRLTRLVLQATGFDDNMLSHPAQHCLMVELWLTGTVPSDAGEHFHSWQVPFAARLSQSACC